MKTISTLLHGNNYSYVIHDTIQAIVIDPGYSQSIMDFIRGNKLDLSAVFLTHHHRDHTAGAFPLQKSTGCEIYGTKESDNGSIKKVSSGSSYLIGETTIQVIGVPGHTDDHVALYIPELKALFTGDTLFVAGCGRFFSGSYGEMWQSLRKVATFSDDTLVYCGHEYTEENLRFAAVVEPGNSDVQDKLKQVKTSLGAGTFTVPSTIGEEKRTNPFLRVENAWAFAELRKRKDLF